jgi:3'(2'), 5'-bisphosphate nucleotidase
MESRLTKPALSDAEFAALLATSAGRVLMEMRASELFEGKALGAAGDAVAQRLIDEALRLHRPDDAVLSEEAVDDKTRTSASRVWIIDPLDGTREYSEGRTDWAVHVALTIDGAPVLGAVALPGLELTLRSDAPAAVPAGNKPPKMLVSRTRPAPQAVSVAETIGAELLPMGSAGAKAMAVVRGEADIYLHAGGQYEWDSCAPVAVALAAGLHVSRIDGSPCVYNQADPYMPDLLICRPEYAEAVLKAVAALPADAPAA